jgi:hypothetical protein
MASSEDTMVQKPLVMVVESEFIIRLEIVEMITEAGDAIIDTPNAGAAIEILQNSGDINAESARPADGNFESAGNGIASQRIGAISASSMRAARFGRIGRALRLTSAHAASPRCSVANSAGRRLQKGVEPLTDNRIAFARGLFEPKSIQNQNPAPPVRDQARDLHCLRGKSHGFSGGAQHVR